MAKDNHSRSESSDGGNSFFLKDACESLGFDAQMHRLLAGARREIRVELPLQRDDGSIETFFGYRVQHHNAFGPYKGGLRFHPTVEIEELRWLACLMSLKTALVELPLGGAKGGIDCDPNSLSRRELQTLTRQFVQRLHRNIGPNIDVPAPDVGTDAQIMGWIHDEYSNIYGFSPAVVTGKPPLIGGSNAREGATGRGVGIVMHEYARHLASTLEGKTAIIQGFGNVGRFTALDLAERGMKVIGIGDTKGAIFDQNGLDINALITHKCQSGSVRGFEEAQQMNSDALLLTPCDYLIPAALGGVLTEQVARQLKAGVVVEAANNPTTYDAQIKLTEREIPVLPDILANAGGVIVSYLEWVQNLQQMPWDDETVSQKFNQQLCKACGHVFAVAAGKSASYREAAYQIATQRLKDAIWTTSI